MKPYLWTYETRLHRKLSKTQCKGLWSSLCPCSLCRLQQGEVEGRWKMQRGKSSLHRNFDGEENKKAKLWNKVTKQHLAFWWKKMKGLKDREKLDKGCNGTKQGFVVEIWVGNTPELQQSWKMAGEQRLVWTGSRKDKVECASRTFLTAYYSYYIFWRHFFFIQLSVNFFFSLWSWTD